MSISQLRTATEALRESEARLRLSVQAANIGLWDWDLITNEVYFSPEWKRQIGYADDELPNRFEEWQSRVHPEDLELTLRKIRAFIANPQGRHEVEFRFRHKDGSYRWIYTQADVLRDATGKPVRMLGCHLEFTEHKVAEEAQLRLAAIVQSSDDAIISKDLDGVITSWNTGAERMFGYTEAEAVGRPITIIIPPELRNEESLILRRLRAGEHIQHYQTFRVTKQATRVDVSLTISPMKDSEGQVVRASKIARDMTERKRAEAALRTSEREQHKIAEQLETERARLIEAQAVAKVGSWETELPSLDITWSEQTHRIFETDPCFHPTRPAFVELIHPEDREKVDAAFEASLEKGAPSRVEYRIVMADGRVKVLEEHWKVFHDGQGRPARLIGTCQDITERKRAEEQLRQAQAGLAHVTRTLAMGELAAAIAHEINQPLAGVVMNANFALREIGSGTPNLEKLREAIAEMAEDGTRAGAVIARIRALLKKEAADRVELDVNDVIQEVAVLVRNEAARNHIQVRLDLATGLPPVLGDRVLLQQVLINLAMNGIDAMRAVIDRPRSLEIKSAKHADGVLIRVQDSGIGLDPDRVTRVFEPFFTTKPQGIGIGLSISRSIIESHGGRLWAEPGPKGAIFQFTLPAHMGDGVS